MSHWRVGPEGVQDSDRQLNLVRDGISKIDDTQLQELLIEAHDSSLEIVVVLPLLEHSPLLERLELPYIHYDDTLSKIAHILGDKGRSRLKHLKLGYLVEEEKGLHDLFRVTGSESSSDINGFTGSNDGLQLLETETLNGFNRKLIEFLPRYFSKSLTVLNMDKSGLPIHLLAEGLNRLPNLKSLRTGVAFGVIEAESDLDSTFQTSWNCLGLTKLDFRVHCDGDSHRNYNPDWRESKEHRILEYLFSQIDRLTKLEEWSLESSMHVLALDNGYLGQLAGLTQLRVLDLSLYRGQLSTKNAKWMIEHWTRLSRFEVSRSFIPGWSPASDKVRPHNSVIKELQSRRPWIQIVFGDIEI
ncbi:hypothetical protein BGX26_010342 [Mortierella sp. AD094]|nr:hypothetical protein BGX26_010342 [Mortierella sp. AD094]